MKFYGLTDRGIERVDNQDTFHIRNVPSRSCSVIAICDGMGGQNSGNFASELACRAFSEYVLAKLTSRKNRNPDIREVLRCGCEEANSVVYTYAGFTEAYKGMGSTLVGGVVYDSGKCCIVNVGDSRAYFLSQRNSSIRQITNDHSLVEMYVRAGILTREQAKSRKDRNIITRAIGAEETVESDLFEITLKHGDLLMMCSDGVTNHISDEEILAFAREYPDPEDFCVQLKRIVYSRGAKDNLTVIAVKNR